MSCDLHVCAPPRVNRYGLSEGNPSEKGPYATRLLHRYRCWHVLTASHPGIRIDAQCALDYVLSHPFLSKTPIVSPNHSIIIIQAAHGESRMTEPDVTLRYCTVSQLGEQLQLTSQAVIRMRYVIP